MEAINAIIDGIDFEEIMPDLQNVMDTLVPIMTWAVRIGPMILLFFGLIYLLVPPKEANHSLGFRTYFGMGSVEAWRFTQRLAGSALSVLGLTLTIVMWVISKGFDQLESFQMMEKAAKCLLWEIILVLAVYLILSIVAMVMFDRHGDRRWEK